jgi:preprotein translocase subunit SecG
MNIVMNLVLALQIVTALVMIGLVLIQHGKGADMGASFGSGASGSLFGATGSANFLSRSTAVCAAVFFVCTLSLAYTANDRPKASAGSVLDRPAAGASAPLAGASAIAASARAASGVALAATVAASAASAAPSAGSAVPAIPQK